MFSSELCKISGNTFFTDHAWTTVCHFFLHHRNYADIWQALLDTVKKIYNSIINLSNLYISWNAALYGSKKAQLWWKL